MEEKKSSILKGKKGLIVGIANERSLAWGIANLSISMVENLPLHIKMMLLKKELFR